ncbi:hypothetical protein FACS189485_19990 [Spirochaetia bacterium]|nr:hypothetical protein FACS189485_19990 [Spirochaetia bacterium]
MKKIYIILSIIGLISCINKNAIGKINASEISLYEYSLNSFVFDELFDGKEYIRYHYGFTSIIWDEIGLEEIYGTPIEDNIVSLYIHSRPYVIGLREIIYKDLTHRYYIFDDNTQRYANLEVNHKLDRLKEINIGDSVEKLITTFGNKYRKWVNNNYMDHSDVENTIYLEYKWLYGEVLFFIENDIIVKIICTFSGTNNTYF